MQHHRAHRPHGTRRRKHLAAAVAAVLILTACSNEPDTGGGGELTGDCATYAPYAGHSGTTVTMFASIISPESDSLQRSWAEFSRCTGITISYEGSNDFESQLPVRVSGGNAPDLAIIPQPGLLAQMVKSGKMVPPGPETVANVDKYWNPTWKAYGTVNATFYAAPMSANMKSLVWYSPKFFSEAGYAVPKTWDELMALSDRIAGAGAAKPWCGGIASGTATGWPATDWVEQVVLRTGGGEVYDKWVSHEIAFNSPEIINAMRIVQGWMLNPNYVNGGFGDVRSIATTTFQDAGRPILRGQCYLLQQASFYGAQWPTGTKIAPDGDVYAFYLPPIDTDVPTPVVGGGEFVAAFADRPEIKAVQAYLSSPEWHTSRVQVATGWVSANQGVDDSLYADPVDRLAAQYLTDPNATFRFDASDLMPPAVGAGQAWRSMTAWVAEGKSIEQTANEIDAAWPK